MSFAKRPTRPPEAEPKPAAAAASPAETPFVPLKSLLDDPDATSPVGAMLRLAAAAIAFFVLLTVVVLSLKPAEWWEEDSSLTSPIRLATSGRQDRPHAMFDLCSPQFCGDLKSPARRRRH